MTPVRYELTTCMIAEYCNRRLAELLSVQEVAILRDYLGYLLTKRKNPPYQKGRLSLNLIATEAGIDVDHLRCVRRQIQPIFDALARTIAAAPPAPRVEAATDEPSPAALTRRKRTVTVPPSRESVRDRKRIPPSPAPADQCPEPLETIWDEPDDFGTALQLHVRRHGETISQLYKAVVRPKEGVYLSTLASWGRGDKVPRSAASLDILRRIERRYRLSDGYFTAKLEHPARGSGGHILQDVSKSQRRRLAWHLPDDFNKRSRREQAEILDWVRSVIVSGSTDYRRYQATTSRQRFAVRFTCIQDAHRATSGEGHSPRSGIVEASKQLNDEMANLLEFKTATFAAFGLQRSGVWGGETAAQRVEHFGLWFGAFAAGPESEVQGFGAPPASLTFAMMIFPQVWDWYLQWRERRRGFFTKWEVDLLSIATALTREETGWLRQTPRIADNLQEINGLITKSDIEHVRSDWAGACDRMFRHARRRIKEIDRVARVHRDPFEPILPVLEASSPVGEYRKITEEILRRMPSEQRYPRAAAEAVRAFLLLRIGLHTGLRQKNLRELMLCKRGQLPTSERRLEDMKRGEIRWSTRDRGWEIFIPSVAFKNANSSFFGSKPFRLVLPDLGSLYEKLEAYIDRHRARLLGPAADPGTFFVKTAKMTSTSGAYSQYTFYEAWRLTIQRYGIFNPYTGRGAIEGLLPHGPHNVRDVLATHILKQTGSYEQASYAIQDTPQMVAQHYGRFLPQDKADIAARILNKAWEAA